MEYMSNSLSRDFAICLPRSKDIYFHHLIAKCRFPVQLIYLRMRKSLFWFVFYLGLNLHAQNSQVPQVLDAAEATRLIHLPLKCLETEYPNKLGQVLGSATDLKEPSALHPAFFGCFDWHSAVHGHWSLARILNTFPEIDGGKEAMEALKIHLTPENIDAEIYFFEDGHNASFERMYGWAWLLKLQVELKSSTHAELKALAGNLEPLSDHIVDKIVLFLPKLVYPVRVGTHTNAAFAMSMIYDYALSYGDVQLQSLVKQRAIDYFANDQSCPMTWEPSGTDFLSPCLEEASLMSKILSTSEFQKWLNTFMPELSDPNYQLEPGIVSDRTDGHLVHLDGLNFSRAWCFFGIAEALKGYDHLVVLGNQHIAHSLPSLVGDSYEGGHWLASFALLALSK